MTTSQQVNTGEVGTAKSTIVSNHHATVRNLTKTFTRRGRSPVHALRDVNLEIRPGELLVLLGPSGCGKTTLLRTLVGLEEPTSGSITLDGKSVSSPSEGVFVKPNRRDVGMVFQNYALWPHMRVHDNVAYPLKARRWKPERTRKRVEEVLALVHCQHLADRYPPELSGGQQQRVSLARALAANPALILFDEPLSNLDALLRIELRAQLRTVHRRVGFTGVYVTHDQEEALSLGTRIAVMQEGQIAQIGEPADIYSSPATDYVAEFLGLRNRLPLTVDADNRALLNDKFLLRLNDLKPAGNYVGRIRPQNLWLRTAAEGGASALPNDAQIVWTAPVVIVEALPNGDSYDCMVELGKHVLHVTMPAANEVFVPGTSAELGVDVGSLHIFDATP